MCSLRCTNEGGRIRRRNRSHEMERKEQWMIESKLRRERKREREIERGGFK